MSCPLPPYPPPLDSPPPLPQLGCPVLPPTPLPLTPPPLPQLRYKEPGQKIYWPTFTVSPKSAEMRADMGNAADFWQMQTFDGPSPETINSRLAMVSDVLPATVVH